MYFTVLAWLVPHETAAISAQVLCIPCNHAPCHFMQSHIRKVYACLAVTCHLHFWQNDRYLLHATAVTRGWNGYQNRSQHRKLTLEKKILPPLLKGFEPATFQSWVQHSNHWAIPKFTLSSCSFFLYRSLVDKRRGAISISLRCRSFSYETHHAFRIENQTFLGAAGRSEHHLCLYIKW